MKPPIQLVALLALAGCVAPADHPSLAPRDYEGRALPPADALPATPPPPAAAAPGTAARIEAMLAEARAATQRFEGQLAEARRVVAAAADAAPGSEAWVAAEQAISRAEAMRGVVPLRLADLDRMRLELGEVAQLDAARAELAAADAEQRTALAELGAKLRRP